MSQRAEEVFHSARERSAGDARSAYLDGACGRDAALRARVEALLIADAAAGDFLRTVHEGAASGVQTGAVTAAPWREGPGTKIGAYKILQLIGEGGFGSVFMAEQEKPVNRKVALKIIKLGMDTRQVIARFEAERQALAMMDHPNIAKVLDAGATEAGLPYFVMELVKGDPIVEYCDKNNLSIEERLELFAQVCNAVQHAHTKGIIHRDIKPSNILVSTQDGRPHTKVIDFGIAKATASKLTEKTLFTEHHALIGTPEYMSPEQAEGSMDIDTRTDVYSLGVLLYELLTGTTPFTSKELRSAAYAEIQRIIREVEPPKPSTRISRNTDTIDNIAAKRHTEPKRLGMIIRGELDWIVMKTLEKDRQRRYETANGLAMDVRRYLSGEAVLAAPPSTPYRFKKFIQRHRVLATTGSAVATALLIGVFAFAWQANEARGQRDIAVRAQKSEAEQRQAAETARAEAQTQQARAEAGETEARKQAAIAEAVTRFQTDMLAAVDPYQLPEDPVTLEKLKDKVTVVQTLDAAVKTLDAGSLKDQPLVEFAVRDTIGMTYYGLARYADAEPNLRKSLALRRAALPAGHPGIAKGLNSLASLLKAQHKLGEAEPLFREALEISRAARHPHAAGHMDIATALNNLALLLMDQHKLAEAEPLLREALEISRATLPAKHADLASSLNNLATLLQAQKKLAQAEPLFREALEIDRAARPAGHPHIAICLDNLAKLLAAQRKFGEAEPLMREALEIRRAAFPAGHADIAKGLGNLASLLADENKRAEAEPLAREALVIVRTVLPAGHPDIAASLRDLASLLQARNELAEAEPLTREALKIDRATLPPGYPGLAVGVSQLALLLQAQNKLTEAEPLFREAVEICRAGLPDGHPDIAKSLNNLAWLLMGQHKLAESEPLLREALEIDRAAFPAGSPEIARDLNFLGLLLMDQHKPAEAESVLREALEIDRAAFPAGHAEIAACLNNLGTLYWRQGQLDRSIPMFEELLKVAEAAFGRQHPDTLRTAANLGAMYKDSGRLPEAIPLLEGAYRASKREPSIAGVGSALLDAYAKVVDPAKPESMARFTRLLQEMLADARANLPKDSAELAGRLAAFSQTLVELKAWDQAEPLIREALTIREVEEPDDWRTFNSRSMLGGTLLGQNKLAEAEPLLLDGYRGMKEREAVIPPQGKVRIPEALERLVRLYEAKGNDTEATAWRSKLEAARADMQSKTKDE